MPHSQASQTTLAPKLSVDPANPIPLYFQIEEHLKRRIANGELAPGSALPGEFDLGEQYGVSRPTVRQALAELIRQGLVERRRGVGTFVTQPRIAQQLGSITGFTERMQHAGRRPSTRLLEQGIVTAAAAGDDVAVALDIAPNARVLRLQRLRLVDGEATLLETVHLPLDRFPGSEELDFAGQSLYTILRQAYGAEFAGLRETLEPVLLNKTDAHLLDTKAGRPAMRAVITTYDCQGRPLEHTYSLVRGDRCQYCIEVKTTDGAPGGSMVLRQTQLEMTL